MIHMTSIWRLISTDYRYPSFIQFELYLLFRQLHILLLRKYHYISLGNVNHHAHTANYEHQQLDSVLRYRNSCYLVHLSL